ncbi:enhancer of mRNA-decapping protein 3 [Hydra vulgaris]|uniref:Enhancer of mRNA-decapping protein 3 n=1 Tax=Hydra vulgaris TaxID=6087 RepID=A0ABM4DPX5_HYDVU
MEDKNANTFIGFYISLSCSNNSVYEGEVSHIDFSKQLITLIHAHQLFPDGTSLKFPRITLTRNHIQNLKILREKIKVTDEPKQSKCFEMNGQNSKIPRDSNKSFSLYNKEKLKSQSLNLDQVEVYPDFDFEKNLAKFDKRAVYEQMIQNSEESLPNGIPSYDKKMKCQENILESQPLSLRHIKVPLEHAGKEYSTEDGFIVPAITQALKKKLFAEAVNAGLTIQQIIENAGICVCQMTLQLVGGSLRINPNNNHQRPLIVVLAGSHTQGMQAICTARHLVNHTVKVVLYLPEKTLNIKSQLDLFLKSGGKVIHSYKDLPTKPVDLVIDAMMGLESNPKSFDWLPYAISWANQNKAPLLAIDPCLIQSSLEAPDIKWTMAMGLPLINLPKSSRIFLADVGIPKGIFADVGIQYISPFKDKFYIPIYEC